jgi:DNA-binding LytR/AlgR family response regulator
MQVLNCLIVEDEHLAAGVLRDYIAQLPGLSLKGCCEDVFAANELLRREKIDIIFLDINLPRISGLDFIKTLGSKYHIILTTAYHQYAIEGFNLNAVDYLLKPIEFSRFLQAVNKVYDKQLIGPPQSSAPSTGNKFYFFNTDKKKIKVYASEIDYIESMKDYVTIHSGGKKIVTKFQIGELENLLEEGQFLRIHRSFIINTSKVTAYTAQDIELGDISLPLGRTYKEMVEKALKSGPEGY